MSCLFCNIVAGQVPANIVLDDPDVMAFHDISPKAPTHLLIIPKQHITTINDVTEENTLLMGKMVLTAKKIAQEQGLGDEGYRLVFNVNTCGGQAVYHIHLHLLGGRQMSWPPG
jgi:histidine triad (HIT) family protein